ncbi:MAG: tetratricopeptide repeat protein [Candidatus Methanomethylophilaceae archaeon]|jgi:tetratricopeptide (TPR) repeat protein
MKESEYSVMERAKRQNTGGNPKGASETLEDYLKKNPHNTKPRILLANIYIYSLDMFDFGIFQLEAVLDIEPDNTDALKAMVTALGSQKKHNKETYEYYRRLMELDSSAEVLESFARFLRMQLLEFRASAEYYVKAIEADPKNVGYRINYSSLLLNDLREYEEAKRQMEIIMAMDPENYNVRKNLTKLMKDHFDENGNLKKGFLHRPRKRSR